ncbi:DNA damage-inducible protein I [Enterobacteriaceae bacterium LUAb1]
MRIEITVAKNTLLPTGAIEALNTELLKRVHRAFPDTEHQVQVRYAGTNNLTVMGGGKNDKDRISEILQETWESADEWFITTG